jgi:hypothetical protein
MAPGTASIEDAGKLGGQSRSTNWSSKSSSKSILCVAIMIRNDKADSNITRRNALPRAHLLPNSLMNLGISIDFNEEH